MRRNSRTHNYEVVSLFFIQGKIKHKFTETKIFKTQIDKKKL